MSVDVNAVASTCPDGWRNVPLSSVADIRFSSVDKKSESGEKPVRLCNYTDVYNNDYVTADMEFMRATATITEIERFGLSVGDVIITKDSETPDDIGVPTIVDSTTPELVCGYHLALIRPNQNEVDPTFLAKQLSHSRVIRYFGQQANGTTRYGLSTTAIAGTRLHLPSKPQQAAVSRLLRLVDAAIERTGAVIGKLKQVRAGLLHDLLTRGLDDNGELRDPDKHPERFQDSPLGRIPKGWEVRKLCELAEIGSGVTLGRNLDRGGSLELPYLRVANVQDGYLDLSDVKTVHIYHSELTRYQLQHGDVLMNEGGDYDKLGRGTVWESQIPVCLHQNHVFRVRCNPDLVNCYFAAFVSGSSIGRSYFLRSSKQSTNLASINSTQLKAFEVPRPRVREQEIIVARLQNHDGIIAHQQSELKKLTELKSGLMSDLLTGRVSVPENIVEGLTHGVN